MPSTNLWLLFCRPAPLAVLLLLVLVPPPLKL